MTWDGAISALETIITAAGTAATGNDGDSFTLQSGEPAIPPRKMVAWWFDGTGENPLIAETLTDHPYGDSVTIRAYWPVSNRSATPSRTLETEARTFARGMVAGLELDRDLGGNCQVVVLQDVAAGWLAVDNQWFRTVTVPIVLGFTDLEPISL